MSYLELAKKVEAGLNGRQTSPEVVARSILAENETEEAGLILAIWKELFGLRLDREKVLHQLRGLRQWEGQWRENV